MHARSQRATARGCAATLCILGLIHSPAVGKGEGVYEAVELLEREIPLIKTSDEYEERFLRRGLRFADPDLESFVNQIGSKLHPEPTDPYITYRFFLLRDPFPNAFALPNGQVYVHTGMLDMLENEAQLAGLLAHEINHVAGHHGLLFFRSVRKKIITSMVLGPLTLGLSDIFLILALFGYSRDMEEEADRRGIHMMLKAGYDVREMPRLFELLNRDPEGVQPETKTKWSTHPQLETRAAYLREIISQLPEDSLAQATFVDAEGFEGRTRSLAL